jgi:hypothetical protein
MTIAANFLVLAAAITPTGYGQDERPGCAPLPQDGADVERTVQAFFDALREDDEVAFQVVTTGSFDSFDGGKRFRGTELVDVVRDAHAQGVEINWSIGQLDTKIQCDVAWSSWENDGSAGVPPDVLPIRWLESAVLVRDNGNWKIDFFHSHRAVTD